MASTARPAALAESAIAPILPAPTEMPASAAEGVAIDTGNFAPTSTPTTAPPQASLARFTLAQRPPSPPPRTPGAALPMERASAQVPALQRAAPQMGRATPAAPKGRRVIVTPAKPAPAAAPPPPVVPAPVPPAASSASTATTAAMAPVLAPPAPAPLAEVMPSVVQLPPTAPLAPLEAAVPPAPEAPAAPLVTPDALECVTSIEFGTRPEPGMQRAAYLWRDLLDGDPPARAKYGEGGYAVYHAIDVDESVRLTYQTVVSVRSRRRKGEVAHDDHRIVADSRLTVQKRALLEVMDEVRLYADQRAARQREALARKLARRRSAALQRNRLSRGVAFARIKARARLSNSLIRAQRRLIRGVVEVPDALLSGALRVENHLSTRLGRQDLAEGLADSRKLTQDQRSALIFLTAIGLLGAVLLASLSVSLVAPEYAAIYRRLLQDAGTQFVGLFGLPIPIEVPFIFSLKAMGPGLAFTGFFLGKMVGAWVLYLLGDSLRHHLEGKSKKEGAEAPKWLRWVERNGQRYGFPLLFVFNFVPLAPDQVIMVLAISGMRLKTWMWGIALGTACKFGTIVAIYFYLGEHIVEVAFTRPWEFFLH